MQIKFAKTNTILFVGILLHYHLQLNERNKPNPDNFKYKLLYCPNFCKDTQRGFQYCNYKDNFHLNWNRSKRLTTGTVCFIAGAIFTAWSFWWKGEPLSPIATPELEWSWEFCTPNVLLATFGAFLLFSCIGAKADGTPSQHYKAPRLITEIAKLSYGMYLMHIFFLSNIASAIVQDNPASPIIPVWAAIPCIAIACYICCAITTKIISLLLGSKWIIG